jgi:Xaa-Pro aminopeptidase
MSQMLSPREFKERRRRLMRSMKKNSIAIVASAPAVVRNRDVEYPFRQHSDFHYLTGFHEPEAVLVLIPDRKEGPYILFCRPFDPEKAIWTGRHAGLEGAVDDHGADSAYSIETLELELPHLLRNRDQVYFAVGQDADLDEAVFGAVRTLRGEARSGGHPPGTFTDIEPLIHEMRLIKSAHEIEVMRKAAEVSVLGHLRAMRATQQGLHEYDIEAEIAHEFARNGMRNLAYPSIVAGGANACVLHYTENDHPLQDGDLLLIDAGAEYQNYAADITRTFPVNGRFSPAQRALYDLVLEAQLAAIEEVRPGKPWNAPHDAAVKVLTQGLVRLGLLQGKPASLIRSGAYRRFYMHRTGHWLGMDVHDVGAYQIQGKWRPFEPGMVLTVEPGLYVAPDAEDVDPAFRGIGIRIEDDVLVTPEGHDILTRGLPKAAEEIENLMQAAV